MSLVFAEKKNVNEQEIISIHCDTKIGLLDGVGANFSIDEINLIKKYGMVKISIIGTTMCISFAGNNIFLAADLFSQLCKIRVFSVEEAVECAYSVHKGAMSPSDIEFIICSADDDVLRIDCVKDGKIINDCPSAWIGSYDAFRAFQGIRYSDPAPQSSGYDIYSF